MKRTPLKRSTKPMKRTKLKKKSKQKICEYCKKEFTFTIFPSQIKSGHKGIYCSRECSNNFRKSKSFNFPCIICSKIVFTQPTQIKYRNRRTCGHTCNAIVRRLLAEKRRIEEGYTKHQLDRLARYSPEAKKWRIAVFERDDYTCQICGIRGTYLEADHIKPFAYFPELRYDLTNGRTLCRKCHDTTKMSYREMRKIYEKK